MANAGRTKERSKSWSQKKEEDTHPPPQQSLLANNGLMFNPTSHLSPPSYVNISSGSTGVRDPSASPTPIPDDEVAIPVQSSTSSTVTIDLQVDAGAHTHHDSDIEPKTEEEKAADNERQIKLEQERFEKYMKKTSQVSHAKKDSGIQSVPVPPPAPPANNSHLKGLSSLLSPRPAVLLDISGAGSIKGEAGKQATFLIKTKSVALDSSSSDVSITVKINAKDLDGQSIEVPNLVEVQNPNEFRVSYTPTVIGIHVADIYVSGHLGHTLTISVIEGGPIAANTIATWESLHHLTTGNKAQLVVTPLSFIKRLVPLGYSSLSAKVEHLGTNAAVRNVSVLGQKDGSHVVSFYPAEVGDHSVTVFLNGQQICGSPYTFHVAS